MAKSNFIKRFRELVAGMNDTELGFVLGVSADAARKMRVGDIKSLKLHAALRLARELQISPWYLAGEPEPSTGPAQGLPIKSQMQKGDHASEDSKDSAPLKTDLLELRKRIDRVEAAVGKLQARQKGVSGSMSSRPQK